MEQGAAFHARVADIRDDYPRAYATVEQEKAAEARGRRADLMALNERIAYGE